MENNSKEDQEKQPKPFQPKVFLIWLAILAAIIGLVMAQSGEISPSHNTLNSVDELLLAAQEEKIDKATIQSDPKGGDEWYTIQGKVANPAFEIDESQYQSLPFIVKGRVTESEYKQLRNLLETNYEKNPPVRSGPIFY